MITLGLIRMKKVEVKITPPNIVKTNADHIGIFLVLN